MSEEVKPYVPMTEEQLAEAMHISVTVNIDKLPQLTGERKIRLR